MSYLQSNNNNNNKIIYKKYNHVTAIMPCQHARWQHQRTNTVSVIRYQGWLD